MTKDLEGLLVGPVVEDGAEVVCACALYGLRGEDIVGYGGDVVRKRGCDGGDDDG